jgi:hypothetical protein
MIMSVVTSVGTVGSKKLPPPGGALAAGDDLRALLDGAVTCASTFSTAFMSITS